jgi:hypothetical protein
LKGRSPRLRKDLVATGSVAGTRKNFFPLVLTDDPRRLLFGVLPHPPYAFACALDNACSAAADLSFPLRWRDISCARSTRTTGVPFVDTPRCNTESATTRGETVSRTLSEDNHVYGDGVRPCACALAFQTCFLDSGVGPWEL